MALHPLIPDFKLVCEYDIDIVKKTDVLMIRIEVTIDVERYLQHIFFNPLINY